MANNCESIHEDLLNKVGKPNINLRRTRILFIEIYRTLSHVNPDFKEDLFRLCVTNRLQRLQRIKV